jgi:hypothetical protein
MDAVGASSVSTVTSDLVSPPTIIGQNVSNSPVVAVSPSGYAVAVWTFFDGAQDHVQSAILPLSGSWTVLPGYVSDPAEDAQLPNVVVDSSGNAVAVWEIFNGSTSRVQAARLPFGSSTWISATADLATGITLDTGAKTQLGIDALGNTTAGWINALGASSFIQSARLPSGSDTWTSLTDIAANIPSNLTLEVDPAGNAVAVWEARSGFKTILQGASIAFNATIWTQTADLTTSSVNSFNPSLGVDGSGNAIAMWATGFAPSTLVIKASKLPFGTTTWLATSDVTVPEQGAFHPSIAVAPSGYAVASWQFKHTPSEFVIQGATLAVGSFSWSTPVDLTSLNQNNSRVPTTAVDPLGNAIVLWSQDIGSQTFLMGSLLPYGLPWIPGMILSPLNTNIDALNPSVALSANNYGVVAYEGVSPSEFLVLASHLNSPFSPVPPFSLSGEVMYNRFASQTDIIHRLEWPATIDPSVVAYYLKRNGQLIAVIPVGGPHFYEDHNRKKKNSDVYSLTSVRADQTEGLPLTLALP